MECPFKLDYTEVYEVASEHRVGGKKGHIKRKYYYQECAEFSCPAWQETLQDCRLALGGMERVTVPYRLDTEPNINGGGE